MPASAGGGMAVAVVSAVAKGAGTAEKVVVVVEAGKRAGAQVGAGILPGRVGTLHRMGTGARGHDGGRREGVKKKGRVEGETGEE